MLKSSEIMRKNAETHHKTTIYRGLVGPRKTAQSQS
jgi:hypothetical protein